MSARTRIKICGLTRAEDVDAAVAAGADAIGFVFYPASARYIAPAAAAALIARVPPFVTTVGLFVNAGADEVAAAVAEAPVSLLQFHGDESSEQCGASADCVRRPFLRAMRIGGAAGMPDLLACEREYRASRWFAGLLLDTYSDAYGGSGHCFDWSLIPPALAPRIVLGGGLNAGNAAEAIRRVGPAALDVSSGVEQAKGIKDAARIRDFIAAARAGDGARAHSGAGQD
ncbi:MAG: phosphoribosylanthranilate isomerase [Burkholderiaceae bacterium]